MPKVLLTFFIVSLFVLGCQPTSSKPQPKSTKAPETINSDPKPKAEEWPPERILKDREGYVKSIIENLASRLQDLSARRDKMAKSKQDLKLSSDALDDNLAEISNLLERSKKCYSKAKDESRWPTKFAGQSYSEDALKTVISQASKYLEQRESLAKTYEKAHRKNDKDIKNIDEKIEEYRHESEKLSINLERLKISQEGNVKDISQADTDVYIPPSTIFEEEDSEVNIDDLISDSKASEKSMGSFLK